MKNIFLDSTTRTLLKNKTRAIATLIGVVISISMITAVMFAAASFHNFMKNIVREDRGSWSIAIEDMGKDIKEEIDEKEIEYGSIEGVAYGVLDGSANPQKPFLFLANMDKEMETLSEFKLLKGRMPKTENEIVLPKHLSSNGGIDYDIGENIYIDLGIRVDIEEGYELSQYDSYNTRSEMFVKNSEKSFKVVGISERLVVEPYMSAGYTAIVKDQFHISDSKMTFFKESDYTQVKSILDKHYGGHKNIFYNEPLLSINGSMEGENRRGFIFTFTATFLLLISIGACMLMYNTFITSVRERKRQYEIFASVGATESQLRRMTLYEGGFLAVVGIPIGMLLGGTLIYVALILIGDNLAEAITLTSNYTISFYVSSEMILLVLLMSAILVQISVMFPAYRAGKTNSIKNQASDYRNMETENKTFESREIIIKIFGIEGMLAGKNFKRNKKQYRVSIVSLAMSIILFIMASSVIIYAKGGIDAIIGDESGYDISYRGNDKTEVETAYKELSRVDGITKSTSIYATIFTTQIDSAMIEYNVFIIDDETFRGYIEEDGNTDNIYFDSEKPVAVGVSSISTYNAHSGRMEQREIFKKGAKPYILNGRVDGIDREVVIHEYIEDMPKEIVSGIGLPTVIFSQSAAKKWVVGLSEKAFIGKALFRSTNAEQSYEAMKDLCKKNAIIEDRLENTKEIREEANSMLMIIRTFSYVFVILIAIVSITNAFNTVSAIIEMRKIELTTLLALGMGPRVFKRMIYYECLLIGGKTLLYAMPLALFGVFIIFKLVAANIIMGYVLPIKSIVISLICVIMVVFAIMIYIVRKVKEKSPAEVLKKNNF